MAAQIDLKKVALADLNVAICSYKGNKIKADFFNNLLQDERLNVLKQMLKMMCNGYVGRKIHCLSCEHEDSHPSMGIYAEKDINSFVAGDKVAFHCLSCNATYDLFDIVGATFGISRFSDIYAKAVDLFCEQGACREYKSQRPPNSKEHKPYAAKSKYEQVLGWNCYNSIVLPFDENSKSEEYKDVMRYIKSRGLYLYDLPDHYIGSSSVNKNIFAPDVKWWIYPKSGDAYIAFINSNGSVVYRNTNRMSVRNPYFNSKGKVGIFREEQLYNGVCFVCEGCFDALCLQALGFDAVSMNGIENFKALLNKKGIYPILMPDRDIAGLNGVAELRRSFYLPDFYNEGGSDFMLGRNEDINDAFLRVKKDDHEFSEWWFGLFRTYEQAVKHYGLDSEEEDYYYGP